MNELTIKPNVLIDGTLKGAGIALALSVSYLLYLTAILAPIFYSLPGFELLVGMYGFLLGVLPAVVLGAIAGTLIASLYIVIQPVTRTRARLLGGLVSVLLIVVLAIALRIVSELSLTEFSSAILGYGFVYLIPLVIFVSTSIYITGRFFDISTGMLKEIKLKKIAIWLYLPPILLLLLVNIARLSSVVVDKAETLTFSVTWEVSSHEWCATYVELFFVDAQGYGISTCSDTLGFYLKESNKSVVELEMVEKREFTAWQYAIVNVGDWESKNEEWDGLWLHCSSTQPACGKTGPPIKQPYRISSSNQSQ